MSLLMTITTWPNSQIPQFTSPTFHNASFCDRNVHVCTFLLQNSLLWHICPMHVGIFEMIRLKKHKFNIFMFKVCANFNIESQLIKTENPIVRLSQLYNRISGTTTFILIRGKWVNSRWPCDAIWRRESGPALVRMVTCFPDDTKPLPEPVLTYYDPGCPLAFRCEWLEKTTLFDNSFSYVVMKKVFLKNRGLVTSMGGTEL